MSRDLERISGSAGGSAPQASAALGAWAAQLLGGRRTAVLGDSTSGVAEQLAEATNRRVHAYDPDRKRVATTIARARAGGGAVSYAPLDETLDAREAAFDALLVPDLRVLTAEAFEDTEDALNACRRLLSPRGLLVVASPNADEAAPGYYELYDAVSEHFGHVHMLGLAPFVGYTVADFAAEGEPAITVDSSLMEGSEEPAWFVALGSAAALELDAYTLLQLPLERAAGELAAAAGGKAGPPDDLTAALAEAKLQSATAGAELDKLRERERETRRLAEERKAAATALSVQVAELRAEIDQLRKQRDAAARERAAGGRDLDDRLRALQAEHRRAVEQIQELKQKLERAERRLKEERALFQRERETAEEAYQEELDRMLERIAELEEAGAEAAPPVTKPAEPEVLDERTVRGFEFQIAELKKSLEQARAERDQAQRRAREIDALEAQLTELRAAAEQPAPPPDAEDDSARHDIALLESKLRDRGHALEQLERQLRESERIGRELVRELESARQAAELPAPEAPPPGAGEPAAGEPTEAMAAQLAALQQKCSRYEADLQAAQWKIASLSQQVADRPDTSDQLALEQALRAAQDELAGLRRKLEEQRSD